ncbi:glycoside hydrolase family 5 protein [Oceanithermus sp.]
MSRVVLTVLLLAFAPALAVTPAGYVGRLGVGLDVNWANFRWAMRAFDERAPRDLARMGFDHVRIRASRPATGDYLDHLERVVKSSLAAGLRPILAYDGGRLNEAPGPAALGEAVAWWRAVAARFAGYPDELAFDLYIEPAKAMNQRPDLLLAYYREAIAAIRKTNPTRLLFLAPRYAASPAYLPELEPLFASDPHLAAESHFYAAGPSKTKPAKLWTTGAPAERRRVQQLIDQIVAWRERTGVPVWQGAWMPGNYNKGNEYAVSEQVAFATFMACRLRAANVPYAVNADQHFYDLKRLRWREAMLPVVRALVRPDCP